MVERFTLKELETLAAQLSHHCDADLHYWRASFSDPLGDEPVPTLSDALGLTERLQELVGL